MRATPSSLQSSPFDFAWVILQSNANINTSGSLGPAIEINRAVQYGEHEAKIQTHSELL